MRIEKDRRKKNKRQKEKRAGRVEKRDKEDLKIYSPTGQLLFSLKSGLSIDYQELIKRARRKTSRSGDRGSKRYKDKRGSL